ncbi:hypothetical protein IOC53_11960 [Rathayibacter sp. SD072]|nr:hypothetical protein [Rathayibacter sp. SD072]
MSPSQFAEHEEWWIEGVVEFVRSRNAAVDEDIVPGMVTIFAIEAERVGLSPICPAGVDSGRFEDLDIWSQ